MVLRTRVFKRFYASHFACWKLFKAGKNFRWKEALDDVLGIKWVTSPNCQGVEEHCSFAAVMFCIY